MVFVYVLKLVIKIDLKK